MVFLSDVIALFLLILLNGIVIGNLLKNQKVLHWFIFFYWGFLTNNIYSRDSCNP
jgi:hypothetical protein